MKRLLRSWRRRALLGLSLVFGLSLLLLPGSTLGAGPTVLAGGPKIEGRPNSTSASHRPLGNDMRLADDLAEVAATPLPTSTNILTLSLVPTPLSAKAIVVVEVQIAVPAAEPVTAWQFNLAFDPTLLQLNTVAAGDFFSHCAASTTFFQSGHTNNAAGQLTAMAGAAVGLPPGQGCTGAGVFARLTFTALGTGTPTFTLSKVRLLAPAAPGHLQTYPAGRYALAGALRLAADLSPLGVQPMVGVENLSCVQADVNGDGVVDVSDLSLVGTHWGETGAPGWIPEDVNRDGVIDIGDIGVIGDC